jgi:hypothetical protein
VPGERGLVHRQILVTAEVRWKGRAGRIDPQKGVRIWRGFDASPDVERLELYFRQSPQDLKGASRASA